MTLEQTMEAVSADLPLKATADFWLEIGRSVDETFRQDIGGLSYYPVWATRTSQPTAD